MKDPYSPVNVLREPFTNELKEELAHWDITIEHEDGTKEFIQHTK